MSDKESKSKKKKKDIPKTNKNEKKMINKIAPLGGDYRSPKNNIEEDSQMDEGNGGKTIMFDIDRMDKD